MFRRNLLLPVVMFLLFFPAALFSAATTGKIQGYVKDAATGQPLPGANVLIKGTSMGAATNLKGYYFIVNVPPGTYTLVARYIGYRDKTATVRVLPNRTVTQDFALKFRILKGKEVVVTAQAEGQMEAINQQLSASTIKNVVSSARIQEIPDANAAESLGRLPAVSIIRSGGEGSQVVIRGLAPKYNKIQIDGVSLAATSSGNRSDDLSMISPYMLEGIELTKAILPDQEADVLGGTVNFKIKEAPEKRRVDLLVQHGYNAQRSSFGNFKYVLGGSNRFFGKKLGIFAQADIERRNNSSYEMNASYGINNPTLDTTNIVSINNLQLKDITRLVNRYGATLVMDYKFAGGHVKFSNFGSRIVKQTTNRNETYNVDGVEHDYNLNDAKTGMSIFTSDMKWKYNLGPLNLDGGFSGSYADNKAPDRLIFSAAESGAFKKNLDPEAPPTKIPEFAKNDLSLAYLNDIARAHSFSKETEVSGKLNMKYNFQLTGNIGGYIKIGGEYKHKRKKYDVERKRVPIDWGGRQNERDAVLKAFPWMQKIAPLGSKRLPYSLFIDKNYHPNNFLGGNYTIHAMPDLDLAWKTAHVLDGQYFYDYPSSIKNDYHGKETYKAAYFMSSLEFGHKVTLIPGFRYEQNQTAYSGVRGSSEERKWNEGYVHTDTVTTRKNSFILPMVHLRIKPVKWFDVRLAFTKTLSRPDYNRLRPSWDIGLNVVQWNNPFLKPAVAKNYDIYFSFYGNTLGLFTVGAFKKSIKDLIFWTGRRAILDPKDYGLPESVAGKVIAGYMNNPYDVKVSGVELEWQTHFWYLPGPLRGLVLTTNYTRSFSEARYPRTIIKTQYLTKPPWVQQTNIDTFYTNRVILQPDHIFNATLGYDYKGFSIRGSVLYQSDIFKSNNFYKELRGHSDDYLRWDISAKQNLPFPGLKILLNLSNITGAVERDVNEGTGYPTREQHYGMTADLGLRYQF